MFCREGKSIEKTSAPVHLLFAHCSETYDEAIKMIGIILFLLFFAIPSLSAEQNKVNEISVDIAFKIILNLEPAQLCKISLVCKKWRDFSNDERLWNYLCEKRLSKHIEKIKPSILVAKKYYFKIEKISALISNMNSFSNEKMLALLNDDELENNLLNYLELRLFLLSLKENVDGKSLVSFLIAHHLVNISTARNAALNALRKASWTKDENSTEKINTTPISIAFELSAAAAVYSPWYLAFAAAHSRTEHGLSKKCWAAANKALEITSIYSIHDPAVKYKSATLALLLNLIESNQEDFQKLYFLKAYEAAHKNLVEQHFTLTNDQVISIIADITWKKSEAIAHVSYIASLKRMLEGLIKKQ